MFEAYVTNPGLYPELGVEVGEYLRFPATVEEVQTLFAHIGIDGKHYDEYFITNYESDVLGLYDCLDEYAGLDELNYLAHLLEGMNENEIEKFEAAIAFGNHTDGVGDLINLAQNLDCFDFYPGIADEECLGRYFAEEMQLIDIPEHIRSYFDYEAYGRDIDLNGIGGFVPGGYLCESGEPFIEYYTGRENIPTEYHIAGSSARNEKEETLSILETIKQFKETPPVPYKDKVGLSHEER
ncbi:MAG: antirestriction protein ArdA [Enterocloster citroniae]|nr:antirestriction protein ArdA [Enterocloster citroniae]